jgi:hypothetical protein
MFTYRFVGTSPHDFLYLPADPPARHLEPGDTVDCFEKVDHAHLELDETSSKTKARSTPRPKPSPKKPKPATTTGTAPASPKTEA